MRMQQLGVGGVLALLVLLLLYFDSGSPKAGSSAFTRVQPHDSASAAGAGGDVGKGATVKSAGGGSGDVGTGPGAECRALAALQVCSHRGQGSPGANDTAAAASSPLVERLAALAAAGVGCYDIDVVTTSDGKLVVGYGPHIAAALHKAGRPVKAGQQVESVPWSEYVQAGLTERYPQLAEVLEAFEKIVAQAGHKVAATTGSSSSSSSDGSSGGAAEGAGAAAAGSGAGATGDATGSAAAGGTSGTDGGAAAATAASTTDTTVSTGSSTGTLGGAGAGTSQDGAAAATVTGGAAAAGASDADTAAGGTGATEGAAGAGGGAAGGGTKETGSAAAAAAAMDGGRRRHHHYRRRRLLQDVDTSSTTTTATGASTSSSSSSSSSTGIGSSKQRPLLLVELKDGALSERSVGQLHNLSRALGLEAFVGVWLVRRPEPHPSTKEVDAYLRRPGVGLTKVLGLPDSSRLPNGTLVPIPDAEAALLHSDDPFPAAAYDAYGPSTPHTDAFLQQVAALAAAGAGSEGAATAAAGDGAGGGGAAGRGRAKPVVWWMVDTEAEAGRAARLGASVVVSNDPLGLAAQLAAATAACGGRDGGAGPGEASAAGAKRTVAGLAEEAARISHEAGQGQGEGQGEGQGKEQADAASSEDTASGSTGGGAADGGAATEPEDRGQQAGAEEVQESGGAGSAGRQR
ncbi:hypothetical protein HXX76_015060 [Chlamydomonas incerta]|uniref:Glycerophosphodiester phosphodiesterase n=1 Tax=Chlamydomonas incerta TaxID=51695 RepID=A0A835SK17_CHLIN|nr:hypothetical protein HXX76_015060 [Chlamydomonas incerta]|eukprot:KAG2423784.1 hypothetical protein HXX76_015060 [Chlamydomonas incerta]